MDNSPCSVAGGVQGTQGGLWAGTGPKKALGSRAAVATTAECSPVSRVRGRIRRAVEASKREGGEKLPDWATVGGHGALHVLETWWEA